VHNRMGVLLRAGARSPQCLVPRYAGCNMFAPSSPQCGMQYVCTKFPTMQDAIFLHQVPHNAVYHIFTKFLTMYRAVAHFKNDF
jgi:hypothetical protein